MDFKKYGTFDEEEFISWKELLKNEAIVTGPFGTSIVGQDNGYIFLPNLNIDKKVKKISCPVEFVGVERIDLENVVKISEEALRNLHVKEFICTNNTFRSFDGVLYNLQEKSLVKFPSLSEIVSFEIPEWVVKIEKGAFAGSNVEIITIPDSLRIIDEDAFMDAEKLRTVYLGKNVRIIKRNAFKNAALKEIELPESVEIIEDGAFEGNQLEYLTGNVNLEKIGHNSFSKNRLKEIKLASKTKYEKDSFVQGTDYIMR